MNAPVPEHIVHAAAGSAYAAWQHALTSIGRDPGLPWASLAPEEREEQVRFVGMLFEGVNPADQHAAWVASMQADGWTWGARFDASTRTHPGLCEWERLGRLQRLRDVLRDQVAHAFVDAWRLYTDEGGE